MSKLSWQIPLTIWIVKALSNSTEKTWMFHEVETQNGSALIKKNGFIINASAVLKCGKVGWVVWIDEYHVIPFSTLFLNICCLSRETFRLTRSRTILRSSTQIIFSQFPEQTLSCHADKYNLFVFSTLLHPSTMLTSLLVLLSVYVFATAITLPFFEHVA